ncbi:hypothetical protein GOB87_04970 [Acetobacter estunensis]|uniref:Uncharacterized protein n=1 Tax=Acetobacter estunensis TaxID=104097 RepID=A0A967B6I4_9PROT|nr:hypothetical protein [Acetobacter estunensis]NHO53314.1 hypothetical protein [Acetobacter estunensis]
MIFASLARELRFSASEILQMPYEEVAFWCASPSGLAERHREAIEAQG